ncbi:hypothetical protein SteCoe_35920 [Stentor coeruleus]|uniref:UBC core domain-containing protein n=1 Tax=Stentor coeruleus TaxID=5963 RepID=A0A1R2AR66_9CILI|nr:hypothetical protein SteCoe_35920 [Stentor coeruleus]
MPKPSSSNLPYEDYRELLRYGLLLKKASQDIIDDLVYSCQSKEEAIMILDLPPTYNNLPISESIKCLEFGNSSIPNSIKSELIKNGINAEVAELLSISCSSLEEALLNLELQSSNCPQAFLDPNEEFKENEDINTEYFEKLKDYRISICENKSVFDNFSILDDVSECSLTLKRINKEMKSLSTSSPIHSNASIFSLFDSESNHRVKFLISGNNDTPYAHGLYAFDVLLPSNYPIFPPKVNFITTGGGTVRFSPNIYQNGKVCLSIIGTWPGNSEEQWDPTKSTMLQVMISIQSLIMDNNIFQKEPAFSSLEADAIENKNYQMEVKYANMKFAMIEHLKNPLKGFENVIKLHFKIKAKEILKTTSRWVNEAKKCKGIHFSMQNEKIGDLFNRETPGKVFELLHEELTKLLKNL